MKEIGGQILKPAASLGQRPSLADTGVGLHQPLRRPAEVAAARRSARSRNCASPAMAPTARARRWPARPKARRWRRRSPDRRGSHGHRDYVIKVLLQRADRPDRRQDYPGGVMVPMGTNTDEWIADVASYVRNSFGNSGGMVTPSTWPRPQSDRPRKSPWTLDELLPTVPAPLTNASEWKVSASHNAAAAATSSRRRRRVRAGIRARRSSRGCGSRLSCRRPTPIAGLEIDLRQPVAAADAGSRRWPPGGRAGCVQRAGVHGWRHVAAAGRRRRRLDADYDRHVTAGARPVHPDQSNRYRGERSGMGYPAGPVLTVGRNSNQQ